MLSLDFTPCKVNISIFVVGKRDLGGLDLVKVQRSDWYGWDMNFRSSYSKVHALDRAPFFAILTRSLKDAPPLGPAPRFLPGQGSETMKLLVGML